MAISAVSNTQSSHSSVPGRVRVLSRTDAFRKREGKKTVLVAHSMGSTVALVSGSNSLFLRLLF